MFKFDFQSLNLLLQVQEVEEVSNGASAGAFFSFAIGNRESSQYPVSHSSGTLLL